MARSVSRSANASQARTIGPQLEVSSVVCSHRRSAPKPVRSRYASALVYEYCISSLSQDWPPQNDFYKECPDLYHAFITGVPCPNYVRRDGIRNLAAHYPSNGVAPDLGMDCMIVAFLSRN